MSGSTPAKRRRGGQPGNQNAKGNHGNPRPQPNHGNRGGKGAPKGNQFARRKPRSLHAAILPEYEHNPEAREWIEANREALRALPNEGTATDPVDIAGYLGLTPETIAEKRMELELGLFIAPEPQDPGETARPRKSFRRGIFDIQSSRQECELAA